jgi:hypothetical protein
MTQKKENSLSSNRWKKKLRALSLIFLLLIPAVVFFPKFTIPSVDLSFSSIKNLFNHETVISTKPVDLKLSAPKAESKWNFCVREKDSSEVKCDYQGTPFVATIQKYVPNKELNFKVCWGKGRCGYHTSDGTSVGGQYINTYWPRGTFKGTWKITSSDENNFSGFTIGKAGGDSEQTFVFSLTRIQ